MEYVNLAQTASAIKWRLESEADQLPEYTGYIEDAISEIADYAVSIYTADLLEFATEHPEDMNAAACEFGIEPGMYDNWTSYTEAVAGAAWYDKARADIYDELAQGLELVAIDELAKHGLVSIPADAYDEVMTFDADDLAGDDLEDFRAEAYGRYLAMNAWA